MSLDLMDKVFEVFESIFMNGIGLYHSFLVMSLSDVGIKFMAL